MENKIVVLFSGTPCTAPLYTKENIAPKIFRALALSFSLLIGISASPWHLPISATPDSYSTKNHPLTDPTLYRSLTSGIFVVRSTPLVFLRFWLATQHDALAEQVAIDWRVCLTPTSRYNEQTPRTVNGWHSLRQSPRVHCSGGTVELCLLDNHWRFTAPSLSDDRDNPPFSRLLGQSHLPRPGLTN